jgi:hypothetical protein
MIRLPAPKGKERHIGRNKESIGCVQGNTTTLQEHLPYMTK